MADDTCASDAADGSLHPASCDLISYCRRFVAATKGKGQSATDYRLDFDRVTSALREARLTNSEALAASVMLEFKRDMQAEIRQEIQALKDEIKTLRAAIT